MLLLHFICELDLEDASHMATAYEEEPLGNVSPEQQEPSISPLPLSELVGHAVDTEGDTVDLSPAAATASALPGGYLWTCTLVTRVWC